MIKRSFIKCISLISTIIISCFAGLTVSAQINPIITTDSSSIRQKDRSYYKSQMDLVDIVYLILKKNPDTRLDSNGIKENKIYTSVGPILEYTLSTGFTTGIAASGSFLTSKKGETNTSIIIGAVKITEKHQFLLPIQSSVWTHSNKYNFVGDWRYLNYP
jgi:hypothetical protein